jgi:hypothetical protein
MIAEKLDTPCGAGHGDRPAAKPLSKGSRSTDLEFGRCGHVFPDRSSRSVGVDGTKTIPLFSDSVTQTNVVARASAVVVASRSR